MSTEADPNISPDVPRGRKTFIPLECNPDLLTTLVHKLGLGTNLSFQDVYSLTDPDLLSFIPRPALALLLVFPVSPSYESHRVAEDADREEHTSHGESEDPVWFKQTIRNACGMMGILHAVSNGQAREFIVPNSPLTKLLDQALPLPPAERAQVLENSEELEKAHRSAATRGDTAVPDADDDVELHYVCFVKSTKDNQLYELDGRRKGPLARGELGEHDDVLCDHAREVVQGFVEREKESGRVDFAIVALVPNLD